MPMTPTIGRLILAALLMSGGLLCRSAAGIADDLATRHERIATLRFDTAEDPDVSGSWLASLTIAVDPDVLHHWATEDYWLLRYDALTGVERRDNDDDPVVLLIAANAAFRKSQGESRAGATSVDRLDQVLQGYASVLKNGGFDRDAAYNYEYVARVRDSIARAKPTAEGGPPRASAVPPPKAVLPERIGPTIHGRPGMHPPPTRGEEFDVLTPMDFGDREAQPEPTPGRRLPRKG